MTITISYGVGPQTFTTYAPSDSSDKITGAFFDQNSFNLNERPNWITNYSGKRDGGFKHRYGDKDKQMMVVLHLTGTSRYAHLQTWRSMSGTVMTVSFDTDSNLDGDYVYTSFRPVYLPTSKRISITMVWEQYNN